MKLKLSRKLTLLTATMLTVLLSACGGSNTKEETTMSSDNRGKTTSEVQTTTKASNSKLNVENPDVVIATDPSNAPYEMRDETGQMIGLDVDIINAIATSQSFTYNFKPRKWQGIFEEIDNNSSDMISGLVVVTDERQEKYDFTDPVYFKKRYAYMKDSTKANNTIKSFSDICSLKVAVKAKTDKSALYDEVCGAKNKNKLSVSSSYTAFEQMVGGTADVAIGDDILFTYLIHDNGVRGIEMIAEPNAQSIALAWPVKKGNAELIEQFNVGLQQLKDSGEYDKLVEKWFVGN